MKSAYYVVDRIEGKVAVVERPDGSMVDVPKASLPAACRSEGAVFTAPTDGATTIWKDAKRDRDEERRRVTALTKRMNSLRRKDAGGDVDL